MSVTVVVVVVVAVVTVVVAVVDDASALVSSAFVISSTELLPELLFFEEQPVTEAKALTPIAAARIMLIYFFIAIPHFVVLCLQVYCSIHFQKMLRNYKTVIMLF